jgi:hypothetical protein
VPTPTAELDESPNAASSPRCAVRHERESVVCGRGSTDSASCANVAPAIQEPPERLNRCPGTALIWRIAALLKHRRLHFDRQPSRYRAAISVLDLQRSTPSRSRNSAVRSGSVPHAQVPGLLGDSSRREDQALRETKAQVEHEQPNRNRAENAAAVKAGSRPGRLGITGDLAQGNTGSSTGLTSRVDRAKRIGSSTVSHMLLFEVQVSSSGWLPSYWPANGGVWWLAAW